MSRSRRKCSKRLNHGKELLEEGNSFYVAALKLQEMDFLPSELDSIVDNPNQFVLVKHLAGSNTETGQWQYQIESPVPEATKRPKKFLLPADVLIESKLALGEGETLLAAAAAAAGKARRGSPGGGAGGGGPPAPKRARTKKALGGEGGSGGGGGGGGGGEEEGEGGEGAEEGRGEAPRSKAEEATTGAADTSKRSSRKRVPKKQWSPEASEEEDAGDDQECEEEEEEEEYTTPARRRKKSGGGARGGPSVTTKKQKRKPAAATAAAKKKKGKGGGEEEEEGGEGEPAAAAAAAAEGGGSSAGPAVGPKYIMKDDNYKELIYEVVKDTTQQGEFACGGKLDPAIWAPSLEVRGIGRIGLPLCPEQARALVAKCERAPFGRGEETVVDEAVRRVWQLGAAQVKIPRKGLKQLTAMACRQLGLDAKALDIEAHLHKFLLYEKGGHFKRHTDTEKEEGMFGTLLVQLPAAHTGGELLVDHLGERKTFAHAAGSADGCFWSAFFADCQHQLEPVLSGHRMVLSFNLVRLSPGALSAPSGFIPQHMALREAARAWCTEPTGPVKLGLRLDHKYTQASLSFDVFKGRDKLVVDMLRSASSKEEGGAEDKEKQELFAVHLATLTKKDSGTAEDYGGRKKVDTSKMEDLGNTEYSTDKWVGPEGPVEKFTPMKVIEQGFRTVRRRAGPALELDLETEFLAEGGQTGDDAKYQAFDDGNPDDVEYEGYQGNYAGTLEHWYYTTMMRVVIWPKQYTGLIKLDQNFNGINERLKKEFHELPKDQPAPSVFAKKMDTMAFFCGKNPRKIGPGNLEGLLPMCQTEKQVQAVLGALAQVGHLPGSAANLVEKYGWGSAVGQKVGACLAAVGGSGSYHGEKAKPGLRLVRGFLEDGKEFGVEAARKFLGAYLESKIRRDDKHPDFEFEDPGFLADVYLCLRRCRPELEDLSTLFLAGARELRTGKLVALLGEERLKAEVAAEGLPELAGLLSRSLLRPPERKLGGYDFSSYHAYSAAVAKQAKESNAPTVSVADAQAALEFGLSLGGDGAAAAALLRDVAEFLLAVAPAATLAGLFSPKGSYAPETALLKALKAGGSGSRPLRELCQAVLNRARAPAKPALCLRFPGATVPHDAGFEAFLRGNEEKWVRRGFGGEKYARAWAEAVAGPQVCGAPAVWPGAYGSERGFPLHDAGKTWEVTCKRQGGGDATCLVLTKSRAKYEQALRDYSAATQEASRLRGYLQAGGGEITEGMEELAAAVAARKEVETKAFAAEAAAAKKAADEAAAAAAAAAAAKKTANAAAASAAAATAAPPASGAAGAAAGGNKKPRAKKEAKPKPADPTHTLRTVTVEGGRGSQADKCLVDGRSGVARFALAPGQGLAQLKAELRKRFGKAKGQRLGALHVVVGGVPSAKPAKPADLVEGARLRASYVAAMGNPGSLRPFRPGRGHPGFRGGGGYGDEDGCAVM